MKEINPKLYALEHPIRVTEAIRASINSLPDYCESRGRVLTDMTRVLCGRQKTETRWFLGIHLNIARRSVKERVDRRCSIISACLPEGLHLLIILEPRAIIQAVVSLDMSILGVEFLAATLAKAAAHMARQPRRRQVGIVTIHVAAWMEDVPDKYGEEHRCGFQNVEQGLILRQRVTDA